MNNYLIYFKRLIFCCVLVLLAGAPRCHIQIAQAQTGSRGWINENYSYEDLRLNSGTIYSSKYNAHFRSCTFTGKIISTSINERKNVSITFHAFNVFNEQIWESTVRIQSLPPHESYEFSNKVSCKVKNPYRWEIDVSEPGQMTGD